MRKRILALTLAFVIIMSLGVTVTAGPGPLDFEYEDDGSSVIITGYIGEGGEVTIPSEIEGLPVTAIGEMAFFFCQSVTAVNIPDSVTTIGFGAFAITAIESVTVSQYVTDIDDAAFAACPYLTEIIVDENNANYESVDGLLFNEDLTVLMQYPAGITDDTFEIPDGVTEISLGAFDGNEHLVTVILPDGVTSIGDYAFENCESLESIYIPASVTTIGDDIFFSCGDLTIYGFAGSAAEEYAEDYEINFVDLSDTDDPDEPEEPIVPEIKDPVEDTDDVPHTGI